VVAAFRLFDSDGDGYVTESELTNATQSVHLKDHADYHGV
jgi:Ca2+-binding EF-hand superfamily protein